MRRIPFDRPYMQQLYQLNLIHAMSASLRGVRDEAILSARLHRDRFAATRDDGRD